MSKYLKKQRLIVLNGGQEYDMIIVLWKVTFVTGFGTFLYCYTNTKRSVNMQWVYVTKRFISKYLFYTKNFVK